MLMESTFYNRHLIFETSLQLQVSFTTCQLEENTEKNTCSCLVGQNHNVKLANKSPGNVAQFKYLRMRVRSQYCSHE
jgi:hypothetical protein